jgi:hypothetical protein
MSFEVSSYFLTYKGKVHRELWTLRSFDLTTKKHADFSQHHEINCFKEIQSKKVIYVIVRMGFNDTPLGTKKKLEKEVNKQPSYNFYNDGI